MRKISSLDARSSALDDELELLVTDLRNTRRAAFRRAAVARILSMIGVVLFGAFAFFPARGTGAGEADRAQADALDPSLVAAPGRHGGARVGGEEAVIAGDRTQGSAVRGEASRAFRVEGSEAPGEWQAARRHQAEGRSTP